MVASQNVDAFFALQSRGPRKLPHLHHKACFSCHLVYPDQRFQMCSFHLPTSVSWWKMSGVCSEASWGPFGHCGLRIVRVVNMLGMCHPRPGMRFSSHLLLFPSQLTGDYGVDVALRSVGPPKPWRHLCATGAGPIEEKLSKHHRAACCSLCSFLRSRTKMYL